MKTTEHDQTPEARQAAQLDALSTTLFTQSGALIEELHAAVETLSLLQELTLRYIEPTETPSVETLLQAYEYIETLRLESKQNHFLATVAETNPGELHSPLKLRFVEVKLQLIDMIAELLCEKLWPLLLCDQVVTFPRFAPADFHSSILLAAARKLREKSRAKQVVTFYFEKEPPPNADFTHYADRGIPLETVGTWTALAFTDKIEPCFVTLKPAQELLSLSQLLHSQQAEKPRKLWQLGPKKLPTQIYSMWREAVITELSATSTSDEAAVRKLMKQLQKSIEQRLAESILTGRAQNIYTSLTNATHVILNPDNERKLLSYLNDEIFPAAARRIFMEIWSQLSR